jgi:hypothetical protein
MLERSYWELTRVRSPVRTGKSDRILNALEVGKQSAQYKKVRAVLDQMTTENRLLNPLLVSYTRSLPPTEASLPRTGCDTPQSWLDYRGALFPPRLHPLNHHHDE